MKRPPLILYIRERLMVRGDQPLHLKINHHIGHGELRQIKVTGKHVLAHDDGYAVISHHLGAEGGQETPDLSLCSAPRLI